MLLRVLIAVGLEWVAIVLAQLHMHLGVHTDEAKYLLNIPYPHPPLMRWIMGLTDGWQHQEIFWRIVFASFLVQGVWMVWDMGRKLQRSERLTLCGLWLFSSAVLFQSGTIFLSVITATQVLCLLWMLSRAELLRRCSVILALLWLEMLFSAYQGILFAPLIYSALSVSGISRLRKWCALLLPVALLVLYTFTNPFSIAAFGLVGGMGSGSTASAFLHHIFALLFLGSGILGVLGALGMLRSRHGALCLTCVLLIAYSALSYREYYAILFVPVCIAGVLCSPGVLRWPRLMLATQVVLGMTMVVTMPLPRLSHAREVGEALRKTGDRLGDVVILGNFGHEWQYWMPSRVRRVRGACEDVPSAIVCLDPCPDLDPKIWWRIPDLSEEVYVQMIGTVVECD